MLATYKPAENTPVSFELADHAITAALSSALGKEPPLKARALALAKTVLEAGRQGELLWAYSKCFCIGNIKAGPNYLGMFTTYTCNEVLGGKVVWFSPFGRLAGKGGVVVSEASENPPGHYQTRFRAYANVFDGAYQYVDFIASGRYVDAWSELLEGDAAGYVAALHQKGYFTADPVVYARGVISLCKEFEAKLAGRAASPEFVPTAEYVDSIVAKQEWNQREIQVIAVAAATDAMFDNLEALRRASNRELAQIDPNDEASDEDFPIEEPPTRDDPPRQV